jgi:hypothetical protein
MLESKSAVGGAWNNYYIITANRNKKTQHFAIHQEAIDFARFVKVHLEGVATWDWGNELNAPLTGRRRQK